MGAIIGDGKKYIRDFAVDFTDKEMRLALLAAQPTLSMDGFSEEAVVATKMVAIAKPQKNGEVMFARRYRFNRIMSFLVMDFFEGLQAPYLSGSGCTDGPEGAGEGGGPSC